MNRAGASETEGHVSAGAEAGVRDLKMLLKYATGLKTEGKDYNPRKVDSLQKLEGKHVLPSSLQNKCGLAIQHLDVGPLRQSVDVRSPAL